MVFVRRKAFIENWLRRKGGSIGRVASVMKTIRPRVAVIASAPRSREYGRRVFRLFGCSTLIFMNVDEFLQIGNRSKEISLVFLEHAVPSHALDTLIELDGLGDQVRSAVGDSLPLVHSVSTQQGGTVSGFRTHDILVSGSLSFGQLCLTIREFLKLQNFPVVENSLEWRSGAYRFCIESSVVYVNGKPVMLKAEQFDLALEIFFNKDFEISRERLKSMVPNHQLLRRRSKISDPDAALFQLRDMLGLLPENGWELRVNSGLRYMLVDLERTNSDHA